MAILAAACRRTTTSLIRLRHRPTLSSARAMSFWSSSSSFSNQQDDQDPYAPALRSWASIRANVDNLGATLHDLRLRHALGSAVQASLALAPAADFPGLLAQIEATMDYFPFEISEDNDSIILTRALKGEQIEVQVYMPDDHAEEEGACAVDLVVDVSKGDGSSLKFAGFADPDVVQICTMNFEPPTTKEDEDDDHDLATYNGFDALDEDLQKSFHEYLELRGITPKLMNLLHGYLSSKIQRKHTLWLNKVQEFVKNDLKPEAA